MSDILHLRTGRFHVEETSLRAKAEAAADIIEQLMDQLGEPIVHRALLIATKRFIRKKYG